MRKALIAGNWKMFKTEGEAVLFAEELAPRVADVEDREILVCPP
ncbi:MAG TPA: triose-phosphate isomerase, partial [Deltaproteobacteria bacterium]|nr:triose-phosphate isomerase [Deltaproteobacteria bacterium]